MDLFFVHCSVCISILLTFHIVSSSPGGLRESCLGKLHGSILSVEQHDPLEVNKEIVFVRSSYCI